MGRHDPQVDEYIQQLPEDQAQIVTALRSMIEQNAPALEERLYMGVPTWCDKRPLIYIAEYHDHLNLGFYLGSAIPDPSRLLEGTGKSLRHVKIRSVVQTKSLRLARLVKAAAKLRPKRR